MNSVVLNFLIFFLIFFKIFSAEAEENLVGGTLNFQIAGHSNLGKNYNSPFLSNQNRGTKNYDIISQIYFQSDKKIGKSNLGFYLRIAPYNANHQFSYFKNQKRILEKYSIYLDNDYGHFELGNCSSASEIMKIGAETIAAATGGVNGDYLKYANSDVNNLNISGENLIFLANGSNIDFKETFIFRADSFSDYVANLKFSAYKPVKISYFTPEIKGLEMGVSFAANNTQNLNDLKKINQIIYYGKMKNILSFGASYQYQFANSLILKTAFTGDHASIYSLDNINKKKISSKNLGFEFDYAAFAFAASYGYWGKVPIGNSSSSNQQTKGKYHSLGLAYNQGPFKSSLTHFSSSFAGNNYKSYSLSADFQINKTLLVYAETVYLRRRNSVVFGQGASKTRKIVYLSGIELKF